MTFARSARSARKWPNTRWGGHNAMLSNTQFQMTLKYFCLTAVIAIAIVSSGCGLDQKGMVLFTDPAYKATVIGTNNDGFTVPDGILWKQGRFYIVDEGGGGVRIWSGPGHSTTLCDSKVGVSSPEDMAMDALGNIYFTD